MDLSTPAIFLAATSLGIFLGGRRIIPQRILLAFSAGVLLAVCLLFLLPDALEHYVQQRRSILPICFLIAIGFLTLLGVERFLFGDVLHHHCGHLDVHEHCPSEEHHQKGYNGHEGRIVITLVLALCTHSFFDGLVVGTSGRFYFLQKLGLVLGFILHKVPEAAAFVVALKQGQLSKRIRVFFLLIYSISSPLGLFLGKLMPKLMTQTAFAWLLAFLTGGLLHFVTGHLLPDGLEQTKRSGPWQFIALILGFLVLLGARFID